MRTKLIAAIICTAVLFGGLQVYGQTLKVGVFDLDLMVQAMPGYRSVDSLVQIYERDSLGVEYEYYQNEYARHCLYHEVKIENTNLHGLAIDLYTCK